MRFQAPLWSLNVVQTPFIQPKFVEIELSQSFQPLKKQVFFVYVQSLSRGYRNCNFSHDKSLITLSKKKKKNHYLLVETDGNRQIVEFLGRIQFLIPFTCQ